MPKLFNIFYTDFCSVNSAVKLSNQNGGDLTGKFMVDFLNFLDTLNYIRSLINLKLNTYQRLNVYSNFYVKVATLFKFGFSMSCAYQFVCTIFMLGYVEKRTRLELVMFNER